MINFNSQDVANMYRRNQLANALQERMNAPTPVHTYQGFQAPISPLTGLTKALDVYSVFQNEKNQEDRYQAEKAAAEQKVLNENSRLEQGRENFVSNLNQPIYSETPMPDARSSSESGIPLDQPRADVYTSTPKTPQEKLAFALSRIGDPNQLVSTTAKGYVDQANENIKAQALIDKDALIRKNTLTDYGTKLTDQEKISEIENDRKVEAAKIKQEGEVLIKRMDINNRNMPTEKAKEKLKEKEQGVKNAEETINQLESDYDALNKMGGLRNLDQNIVSRQIPSLENALPYTLQDKDAAMLRERIEANIQSLLGPLMKASGITSQQVNSNVEREAFMKSLGGPGTSYEANKSILQRTRNTLIPGYNKKSQVNDDINQPKTDTSPTEPMFASNGTSRITSTDGGKTWKEVK